MASKANSQQQNNINHPHHAMASAAARDDPEEAASRALRSALCRLCRRHGIACADDPRLVALVARHRARCPALAPARIAAELAVAAEAGAAPEGDGAGAATGSTVPRDIGVEVALPPPPGPRDDDRCDRDDGPSAAAAGRGCPAVVRANRGYNPLTYALLLSCSVVLAFLASVLVAYRGYNRAPYRDWALAGGVTSAAAAFRVRAPASDDGKRREFVVSRNPNLAIERDQIGNAPVAWDDFAEEEHGVKRLQLDSLAPMTTYYYGT